MELSLQLESLWQDQRDEEGRLESLMKDKGKGRPLSHEFEHYVRTLLASGCSAKAARDHILTSARFFVRPHIFKAYASRVPQLRWFQGQREALGNEAWLYSMVELAGAEFVHQWGFDETAIDGTSTLNQWTLIPQEGGKPPKLITMECTGLLIGSTALEICEHVKKSWQRGQMAIDLLRQELGPEFADEYVPVVDGGISLHKIQGSMHDTCATANLVASMMRDVRNTSGQLRFGYDNWESKSEEDKPYFDFLCGNHSRNLPITEFNRKYETYIKEELGEALTTIQSQGGGRTRVESTGPLLLRSLCRLTHKGHAQYAKGDGHRFQDWLGKTYNGQVVNRCAGRAEFSNRQVNTI
jgi:hypothetical protein